MNRYYIDTNILIFISVDRDSIHNDIWEIIKDYNTKLYTSSVCVQEMIHLFQTGKLKSKEVKKTDDVFNLISQAGIKIVSISENHLKEYARLPLYEGHNDPNDRLIISQAISDKIPIISSDLKFALYQKNKLQFIRNKR